MDILINILYPILMVIVIISMIGLIIIVLLQNDKTGGLGIIGGGSSQTGFGSRKADPIVRITQILGILFMVGSFLLAFMNSLSSKQEKAINTNNEIPKIQVQNDEDTTTPETENNENTDNVNENTNNSENEEVNNKDNVDDGSESDPGGSEQETNNE